jgi:hypothetical protein
MTPLARIDCASSSSFASSMCVRGWRGFGARRSMSSSIGFAALRPSTPLGARPSTWLGHARERDGGARGFGNQRAQAAAQ